MTVLIVAAATLVGIVVVGILAAIAIPVFLHQRGLSQAHATTISVPVTFQGMPQVHDALSDTVETPFLNSPAPGPHIAATYAGGANRVTIAAGRHYMSPADQRDYMTGAQDAMLRAVPGLTFDAVDTGRYQGRFSCARIAGRARDVTTCFWADAGSYGLIQVYGQGGTEVARQIRQATETRR